MAVVRSWIRNLRAISPLWRQRLGALVSVFAVTATSIAVLGVDDTLVSEARAGVSSIWLSSESTGEVVQVDGATGSVVSRVLVDEPNSAITVVQDDEGVAVVSDSGTVSILDTALMTVRTTIESGIANVADATGIDPVWVIGLNSVAVAQDDSPGVVNLLDPINSTARNGDKLSVATDVSLLSVSATGEIDEQRSGRFAVVNTASDVVVIDSDGETVSKSATDTSVCLDGKPGVDTMWTGSATADLVAGIDPETRRLFVADLDRDQCRSITIAEENSILGAPVIWGDSAYIPDSALGEVHIIRIRGTASAVAARVTTPGRPLKVAIRGDIVAAYDPTGTEGAVLSSEGVAHDVDTSGRTGPSRAVLNADADLAVIAAGNASGPLVAVDGAEISGRDVSTSVLSNVERVLEEAPLLNSPETDDNADPLADDISDTLIANFAFSTNNAVVNEVVSFIDESNGEPTSWTWDFGDGTGAVGPTAQKSWAVPGTYTVTLEVSNGVETSKLGSVIEVHSEATPRPPVADFIYSSPSVQVGGEVQFEDRSTGGVTQRRWDFGDGTTASGEVVRKAWTAPGIYTVLMTVGNAIGTDTDRIQITVVDSLRPPVASIEVNETTVPVDGAVRLRSSSAGDAARLEWRFGDGAVATGPEVVHTYAAPGIYTVTLTATNEAGSTSAFVAITVVDPVSPPTVRIATVSSTVEVGTEFVFNAITSNKPDTIDWDFGDGQTARGASVSHRWSNPGTYRVSVVAKNKAGSVTSSVTIVVVPAVAEPRAAFSADSPARVGRPIRFTDKSVAATSWAWQFGDGATASTAASVHTYTAPGTFPVTLTVSNSRGSDSATLQIPVLPALPIAQFQVSPEGPQVGDTVNFSNLSTGGVSWRWEFGDGQTSMERDPRHRYDREGTFTARQTVTNSIGETATAQRVIVVSPAPPVVGEIVVSTPLVTGQTITVTASTGVGSGPVSSWEFNFDGVIKTSTMASSTHSFDRAGVYPVTVTAIGPAGARSSGSVSLTVVNPPPPLPPTIQSPASATVGELVTLTATPAPGSGAISSYIWNFGDNQTGLGASVTHSWATPGSYEVSVTAEGPYASALSTTTVVIVAAPAPVIIAIAPGNGTNVTTGTPVQFSAVQPSPPGGPIASWLWEFGDGNTSALASPSHTFATAGTYSVRVTATGPGGPSSPITSLIYVIDPPNIASLTPSATIVQPNTSVTVTGTYGNPPGTINRIVWTVSDGRAPFETNDLNASFEFTVAGIYTITATAHGPLTTDSESVTITVNAPLVINPSWVQTSLETGTVELSANPSGRTPDSVLWTVDSISLAQTGPVVQVTGLAPGVHSVTVRATAGVEVVDRSFDITVQPPPPPP